MKAKELDFIKDMMNDRIKNKMEVYKNNAIILENKDKLKGLNIDFKVLEGKNKRYKEYIMTALNLKTEGDFIKIMKGNFN